MFATDAVFAATPVIVASPFAELVPENDTDPLFVAVPPQVKAVS